MKNKQIIVLVVVLLFLCVGCAKEVPSDTDISSSGSTTSPSVISVEDAKEKILANLPEASYPFYVEFEREEIIEKVNYYYFLVYTMGSEPITGSDGQPLYQRFTYAWIYVDIETGNLYEMDPDGQTLKAWQG